MHLLGLMQLRCCVAVFVLSVHALVLRYYFLYVIVVVIHTPAVIVVVVVIAVIRYSICCILTAQRDWTLIC